MSNPTTKMANEEIARRRSELQSQINQLQIQINTLNEEKRKIEEQIKELDTFCSNFGSQFSKCINGFASIGKTAANIICNQSSIDSTLSELPSINLGISELTSKTVSKMNMAKGTIDQKANDKKNIFNQEINAINGKIDNLNMEISNLQSQLNSL